MTHSTYSILQDFIVLDSTKQASVEARDDTLYERLDHNYNQFKNCELISCHDFEQDWPSWEIHPHGDEIVMLLSGKATMVLEKESGNEQVELEQQGNYVIVPANTWHTAKIHSATRLLFITPGEGTQVRT